MSALERIRHEVREIGLVTAWFLGFFLFFLTLKELILDEYDVEITVLGTAVVGALIVAKVVVLLGKTSFGSGFASQPLLVRVLWRSLLYTAAVFVVTLAERLFDLYRETGALASAVSEAWAGRDVDHFLAMNLAVGMALLVYNLYDAIDDHVGEGGLRRILLSRPGRTPATG